MTQPRTAAGRALQSADPQDVYPRDGTDGLTRRILAIEAEAHDDALGLLLLTGAPVPTSVMSFDNVKRTTEVVEKRIRSQMEHEAAAPLTSASAEADVLRAALEQADKAASYVHDFLCTDGPPDDVNDAIWTIHNALRPLLAQPEREAGE